MAASKMSGGEALLALDALELRDRLASGALKAVDLAAACLERIGKVEPDVQAWSWLESDQVLDQARRLDAFRASGRPVGPLHGMPVALKDIIDTARIPTENGCAVDKGRVPTRDAHVVTRLKAAGAVIMGKTVTTELAFLAPGKTRNPHNHAHTPGGSSSGSAAAVAAGMVPLAVGTQTGGSIIRPAAFCGITGFKPSFGAIARTGVLSQSPFLDTMGVFARSPEGAAMLADALYGYDDGDPFSELGPNPRLLATASAPPPLKPVFAFIRPPGWDRADEEMQAAIGELAEALGADCFEVSLPEAFQQAEAQRRIINFAEMAKCYYGYETRGRELLAAETIDGIEQGKAVLARDYIAALDWRSYLNAALDEIFERCDAILTPAALGPAPHGLSSTGDSLFNGLWTLCGTPAVTVPLFEAGNGLPMGAQLVGRRGNDGRLLRTASWLARFAAALGSETHDMERRHG
jgi:Asp-tRNA(Asn)/Glu-tRNA(Gln) amidotransferase A subunit family amidase